jgi:hypothetical protein
LFNSKDYDKSIRTFKNASIKQDRESTNQPRGVEVTWGRHHLQEGVLG